MSFRLVCLIASLGCQEREPAPAAMATDPTATITVREGAHTLANVVVGPPCRATVDGLELLVGIGDGEGRTLVAAHGATRWTTETAESGTTIRRNDQPAARIHARQLFDDQGAPVIRVLESGDVVNGAGQIIRTTEADAASHTVTITPAVNPGQPARDAITITGTNDVVLAAMLSARETTAEIRALAACHYLLPGSAPADPRVP